MSEADFAPPPSLLANSAARRRASISLTPLIDVVFILIVFFMLASSFFDWRSVLLDAPVKASGGSSINGAMMLEVRTDGLRLSGETLSLDAIASRLADRLRTRPDQRVLVKPGPGVTVQDVLAAVDRLSLAGVKNLSFVGEGRK